MSPSTALERAEELLDEVLQIIRQECENRNPILSEAERMELTKDELSLREHLQKTKESESGSACWRNMIGWASPQAEKCLKDAQDLLQRIKDDVNAKVRTMASGKSSPCLSASGHGQSTDEMTPERDIGVPHADDNHERASTIITSPLNMCSSSLLEVPQLNLAAQHNYECMPDLHEAINTPLDMSIDRAGGSSSPFRRRPPPPPPSRPSGPSKTMRNLGIPAIRRAPSARNGSSPSRGLLPPELATTEDVDAFVSAIIRESMPKQAHGRRAGCDSYKNSCIQIDGSTVKGLTMNNGGAYNSGAVIHETMVPHTYYRPQPVAQY